MILYLSIFERMVYLKVSGCVFGQLRFVNSRCFFPSLLLIYLFFFLDVKEPKNQENPNGQPTCNHPSADFLPPRAGDSSGSFDQQICEELASLFLGLSIVFIFFDSTRFGEGPIIDYNQ